MVLKRCVYGVDKIPMAVELAKVSLWLHTFTVGAPLSFLDHHLRCGDSLFGEWVARAVQRTNEHSSLFLRDPLDRAMRAAAPMQIIEGLTDAEIAEAHRSSDIFSEVSEMTAPLHAFGSYMAECHAFSRALLFVLWWCGQDGFRQFFRYGRDGLLDIENVVCYGAAGAFRFLNLVTGLRGFIYAHGVIGYRVALIHWGRIPK